METIKPKLLEGWQRKQHRIAIKKHKERKRRVLSSRKKKGAHNP
jgi:hypothetical protein